MYSLVVILIAHVVVLSACGGVARCLNGGDGVWTWFDVGTCVRVVVDAWWLCVMALQGV